MRLREMRLTDMDGKNGIFRKLLRMLRIFRSAIAVNDVKVTFRERKKLYPRGLSYF